MMLPYLPLLLKGLLVTLSVSITTLLLGLVMGVLLALLESSRFAGLRYLVVALTSLFRGLPELVILFGIYYGLTALLTIMNGHYVNVNAFSAGVMALGLIFASYACQVFRAASAAIPKGQCDAATALGLSSYQQLFYIKSQLLWRYALPGLGNYWLVLLKDSALVSLLGLSDLMNAAHLASANTGLPFNFYAIAALCYLAITWLSQKGIARVRLMVCAKGA